MAGEIKLKKTAEVEELLKKRGISDREIAEVIATVEKTENKLAMLPEKKKYLGKGVIGETTFYALYSPTGVANEYDVHSAYSHKMKIVGISEQVPSFEVPHTEAFKPAWFCAKCNEKATDINADLTYIGVTRSAAALACPKCKTIYMEEDFATGVLPAAEGLLEKKRA